MKNITCVALLLLHLTLAPALVAQEANVKPTIKETKLGSTKNVHSFGPVLLCGQPSAEDLAEAKQRGIKTVITLREDGEVDWDEPATVEDLGLAFHRIAFREPETLTDDVFDKSLQLLAKSQESPVMLHCGSANRVGAIWMAHRVLNDGLGLDAARDEAKTVGLRTPAYEQIAVAYITKKNAEPKSVSPGINDRFKDPQLDASEWLGRFEIESREVFSAREKVLAACAIKPGNTVADIGAGTGFYSRLFANAVGEKGWVYSVDISPRFLEHINSKSREAGVQNISTVLCPEDAARLPANSVDVAFICDTYHHFEFPQLTIETLHRALKPNGTLIVIDFERIPGESREFIMGHVRAGKEVFQQEIVDAGFRFVEEIKLPELKENYLLRFRK
ncbi:MAG: methyltransferase domain-containing protein [Planctomycetales bacterium]|nr:methyltransferase domain-containing protein [Planctomycetales bacterium]